MRLSRFLFFITILFLSVNGYSQTDIWVWVKGDSLPGTSGNFGVLGVPALSNEPPGRYACGYWVDSSYNFWVYSGSYSVGDDLWKFDSKNSMWTWMKGDSAGNGEEKILTDKGIYDSLNTPGQLGFGMFTWVTPDNHLWLYGGVGINSYNTDLWQYDNNLNQWAWMGGGPLNYGTKGVGDSTTMPGARSEGNSSWTDSNGNLWLFGGFDSLSDAHNDMWEYNVGTGIWTWMSGSPNPDDTGSYGIIGVPSTNNCPTARSTNMFWKDTSGNFWLAGGTRRNENIMFQDVWKFNPQNIEWTWVKGLIGNDTNKVGINCIGDTSDKDGPRYENRTIWQLNDDLIITYSGFQDWDISAGHNDLWIYKTSKNEWIKVSEWNEDGNYAVKGTTNGGNYPPTKFGAVGFKDGNNNLWMFSGLTPFGGPFGYNDLWKYIPDTTCINAAFSGVQGVQEEEQVQLYPNPCSVSSFQFIVSSQLIGSQLEMYNAVGQLVFQSAIRNLQSEIPASGLAAGVYFLSIASANGAIVKKLVKL